MNRSTDNERLLGDVFAESSGAGFPEAMLAGTLRLARRRRRVRQVRRAGSGVVLILLVAAVFWRSLTPAVRKPEIAVTGRPASACPRVTTQPSPGRLVNTRPHSVVPFGNVAVAATIVRTMPGGFDEIGDDELLAFAAPQVVALVRRGPREAELVFVQATEDVPPRN